VSAISDDDQIDIGFLREVEDCAMCRTVGSLPDGQFGVEAFRAKLFDDALENDRDVVVRIGKEFRAGDSRSLDVQDQQSRFVRTGKFLRNGEGLTC
jgi:hypothetical protein